MGNRTSMLTYQLLINNPLARLYKKLHLDTYYYRRSIVFLFSHSIVCNILFTFLLSSYIRSLCYIDF